MSEHAEAKHAFAVTTLGTRTLQRLSKSSAFFLVAFSPLPALAACNPQGVQQTSLAGTRRGIGLLIWHADDWVIFLATVRLSDRMPS